MTCKYCNGTGRQELFSGVVDCQECSIGHDADTLVGRPNSNAAIADALERDLPRLRFEAHKANTLRGVPFAPEDHVIGPSGPGIQQGIAAWLPEPTKAHTVSEVLSLDATENIAQVYVNEDTHAFAICRVPDMFAYDLRVCLRGSAERSGQAVILCRDLTFSPIKTGEARRTEQNGIISAIKAAVAKCMEQLK